MTSPLNSASATRSMNIFSFYLTKFTSSLTSIFCALFGSKDTPVTTPPSLKGRVSCVPREHDPFNQTDIEQRPAPALSQVLRKQKPNKKVLTIWQKGEKYPSPFKLFRMRMLHQISQMI